MTDGQHTILLVDDVPQITSALARVFRGAGFDVLTANTVDDAIALLDQADAVLTDWNMPDGGGSRVLAECVTRGIQCIVHTSDRPAVPVQVLSKPSTNEKLIAAIRGALGGTK